MSNKVKKVRVNDFANYQSAAVVSKTVLAKKAGNITFFAFDKGEKLSEHTAPYDAYVQILDGRARITISAQDYILETGEMIIMPANAPHALIAEEAFKMLLVMIKSE